MPQRGGCWAGVLLLSGTRLLGFMVELCPCLLGLMVEWVYCYSGHCYTVCGSAHCSMIVSDTVICDPPGAT